MSRRVMAWSVAALLPLGSVAILQPWNARPSTESSRTVRAATKDLHVTLTAPGRIQSGKRTLIEAEIQNLSVASEGRVLNAGGRSTIIELVPEGSFVKAGDVLCRLDSSAYEELVRQQEIRVEQSRADHRKAQLDHEAATMALKEYEEGVYVQTRDTLSGQVLLAQSESQRQLDRLQWAETQFKKGYLSASQVTSERLGQLRAVINLARTKGEQARLQRYTAPVTIRSHEARIESLRSTLAYQELRLKRSTEQLTSFRQQVDRCKIKAPHDGFVIYAQDDDDDERIEPGAQVRYKMDMFYLPDLSDMEVVTELHETIVERVREGMTARVRVEALPDFAIEGHVTSISPLPEVNRGARGVSEIRNFRGTVKLHSVPERLRPGMTAEVEIVTAARPSAVVLPPGAVAYERGQGFCLVARDDTVERRPISLGEGTPDLVEVTKGLVPGEEVLLDPSSVDFSEIVRTSGSVPAAESLVSPAD